MGSGVLQVMIEGSEMYPIRSSAPMTERQQLHEAAFGVGRSLMLGDDVVVPDLMVADRMFKRMRGLLGRKMLEPADGLWITPCNSIHMFFMRFAIDAVFIDKNGYVVRVHHHLQPWRMARGGKHAHSVFELPAGRAGQFNIRVGDRLTYA